MGLGCLLGQGREWEEGSEVFQESKRRGKCRLIVLGPGAEMVSWGCEERILFVCL